MTTSARGPEAGVNQRPRTVDYALIAIAAQCVFNVTAAFALRGARSWVYANWHKHNTYPNQTDAQLSKHFDSLINSAMITALLGSILVLVIAKFIRDGRNWARWVYFVMAVVPIPPMGFLFNTTNFLVDLPTTYRLLSGLAGLCTLFALVMLFIRQSSVYFRPAGAARRVSLADLIRPRRPASEDSTNQAAGSGNARPAPAPKQNAVTRPASASETPSTPPSEARPRGKSRKNPVE